MARMIGNSLTPQDKVWVLLHQILQNVLSLKTFLWVSVLNVIHVILKLWKICTEFHSVVTYTLLSS